MGDEAVEAIYWFHGRSGWAGDIAVHAKLLASPRPLQPSLSRSREPLCLSAQVLVIQAAAPRRSHHSPFPGQFGLRKQILDQLASFARKSRKRSPRQAERTSQRGGVCPPALNRKT